jgi:hypothetical protein
MLGRQAVDDAFATLPGRGAALATIAGAGL